MTAPICRAERREPKPMAFPSPEAAVRFWRNEARKWFGLLLDYKTVVGNGESRADHDFRGEIAMRYFTARRLHFEHVKEMHERRRAA